MNEQVQKKLHSTMDSVGTLASLACAIHCILLPFVITLLPLLGLKILGDHDFEKAMLIGTISLAIISLCWGTRTHREHKVLVLPALALMLFGIGLSIEDEMSHALAVAAGGMILATAHFVNKRLCKTCTTCHCCEEEAVKEKSASCCQSGCCTTDEQPVKIGS